MIRTSSFNEEDFPDIVQELTIKLMMVFPKYDPEKGAFASFVRKVFLNSGLKMIIAKRRQITTVPIDSIDLGRMIPKKRRSAL